MPSFCVHDEACDRAPASSSSAGERWSSDSEEDDCLRSATEEEEENVDKSLEAQPIEDVSMTDGLETSPEGGWLRDSLTSYQKKTDRCRRLSFC